MTDLLIGSRLELNHFLVDDRRDDQAGDIGVAEKIAEHAVVNRVGDTHEENLRG